MFQKDCDNCKKITIVLDIVICEKNTMEMKCLCKDCIKKLESKYTIGIQYKEYLTADRKKESVKNDKNLL